MTGPLTTAEDLDPDAWAALENTRFSRPSLVGSVSSTNSELVISAQSGATDGTVLIADYQSAGRGRLSRRWIAEAGSSLLCSVLLRPNLDYEFLPLLGLAAAMSASDACSSLAGATPGCKWPNDLVFAALKVGGVLAEIVPKRPGLGSDQRWPAVVVGLGLNHFGVVPDEIKSFATTLELQNGWAPPRDQLAALYLVHLDQWIAELANPDGREHFLSQFRQRCVTLGQRVKMQFKGEEIVGYAEDLSTSGALLVRLANAQVATVTAGEVALVRAQ